MDGGETVALAKTSQGQMTVEFVVMFPVALVIALVAVNAILFFSECAVFDRVFKTSVTSLAVSPAYGQSIDQSCSEIQHALEETAASDYVDVSVSSSGVQGGLVVFQAELSFSPTLFGSGALTGVFGVSFPALLHTSQMTVEVYKPGVIL